MTDDQSAAANPRLDWVRAGVAGVFAAAGIGLAATGWPVDAGASLGFSTGPERLTGVLLGVLLVAILVFQGISGTLPDVRKAMDEYHSNMRLRPLPPRSVLRLQYGPGPPGVTRRPRSIASVLIATGALGLAVFLLRMIGGW